MQRLSLYIILLSSIVSNAALRPGGGNKNPAPWRQLIVDIQGQQNRHNPGRIIVRHIAPPFIKMDAL